MRIKLSLFTLAMSLSIVHRSDGFQVDLPVDYSWPPVAYADKGLPPIDRVWSLEDYATAKKVLDEVTERNRLHMPRHESYHSGPVFARMFSLENLKPTTDPKIPLADRKKLAMGLFSTTQKFLPLYAKPTSQGLRFDEDHVEVLAFRLAVIRETLQLIHEETATWAEDDPERSNKIGHAEKVKAAMGRVVIATVKELDHNNRKRTPARLTLARYLDQMIPAVLPLLPPKQANAVRDNVVRLGRSYPNTEHGDVLAKLAQKLSK